MGSILSWPQYVKSSTMEIYIFFLDFLDKIFNTSLTVRNYHQFGNDMFRCRFKKLNIAVSNFTAVFQKCPIVNGSALIQVMIVSRTYQTVTQKIIIDKSFHTTLCKG